MRGTISERTARKLYAVLVEHAGAEPTDIVWFLIAHTLGDGCREYRFQGSLGFGGKFRNDGGPWRVDCYPEDQTTERLRTIAATNEALRGLWMAAREEV